MWKHTCQCLILLALASLLCAHHTQAAMMVKDAEEQIHLITDARDIWDLSEPGMDTVGYMCSDLDGNGRLEILVAESGGTGLHTYTKIYEVNEAKDALIPCERSWPDTCSEADVMMTNYVPMSVNGIDGIQWYSFTDEYRDGAEYGTANLALSLQDGTLHAKTIATTHTFYDDAGRPHVSYENAAGASISEKSLSQDIGERFRPLGNHPHLLPMAHLSQGYLSRVEREKPDRHLYHAPRHLSEFQRRKRGDGVMHRGIPRAVILSGR